MYQYRYLWKAGNELHVGDKDSKNTDTHPYMYMVDYAPAAEVVAPGCLLTSPSASSKKYANTLVYSV